MRGAPKTLLVRGRRWKRRDPPDIPEVHQETPALLGLCDYDTRTLYMPGTPRTEDELDTVIHEIIHACTELDEQAVSETAETLSGYLWRLGWRSPPQ